MAYKICGRCGKLHPLGYKCNVGRTYNGGIERQLRNSTNWKKKAVAIKEKANYLCEICKDKGVLKYDGLETHHIIKVKNNTALLLDDFNLLCVCTECHKKADSGKISIEYQKNLANKRENKINDI